MYMRDLRPISPYAADGRRPDRRSIRSWLGTSSPRPSSGRRPKPIKRPSRRPPAQPRVSSGDARRLAGRRPEDSRPAATERTPGRARSTPLREREVRRDVALDVVHDVIGHGDKFPLTTGRRNEASRSPVDGRPASLVRPTAPVGAPQRGIPAPTRHHRRRHRRPVQPNAGCNGHLQPMRPYPGRCVPR